MALFYSAVILSLLCFTNVLPAIDDAQMAREAFDKLTNSAAKNTPADKSYANHVMDTALLHLFDALREQEMEAIPIPEIQEGFSRKVGPVRASGSFRARNGVVSGLTSIHRKGDANMRLEGTSINFDATVGLDALQLDMDYTARLKPISVSGKLRANVNNNAAKCSGGMKFTNGECRIVLNTLELTELGKINLHITGLGPLNWIYSKIATSITAKLHSDIKKTLVQEMKKIVEEEMQGFVCDADLIPT